jgi:hypothetical protein
MSRHFNTAGPCKPDIHYMVPAAGRIPGVRELVETQSCFVLHAPRQSGKTTAILEVAAELTASGRYAAAVVSVEPGAAFDTVGEAELAILSGWRSDLRGRLPAELGLPALPESPPGGRIRDALGLWAAGCPLPLVVFVDEIDGLAPKVLSSVLKQIRSGFPGRPQAFPHSMALVGMRDVRDYALVSGGTARSGAGSPFNVSAESVTLAAFTRAEIVSLYGQHTADTGQAFTAAAIDRVVACTSGQPYLVNALAREAVRANPDAAIDTGDIDRAREALIVRRVTHLDSLAERLRDPRVRRVMEAVLAGDFADGFQDDDLRYALELGLVRAPATGGIEFANAIYREVIPRVLAGRAQQSIPALQPTWLTPAGHIDAARLMEAFVSFWRLNGEPLMRTVEYHEVAPQLVLMAFLHRVVNGGGTLDREFAVGSGRIDLCVRAPGFTMALELKVWRDHMADPTPAGLEQLDRYLERLGLPEGWLVIFDRRSGAPLRGENGETTHETTPGGRAVTIVRLR